jgi:hypothetical protein
MCLLLLFVSFLPLVHELGDFGPPGACVYVYIYIYIYIRIYIYIYILIYIYTYIHTYMLAKGVGMFSAVGARAWRYQPAWIMHGMYVCVYVCMYVCMYLCMYVCVCMYIYIHIYSHRMLIRFLPLVHELVDIGRPGACMYVCVCMYVCMYVFSESESFGLGRLLCAFVCICC